MEAVHVATITSAIDDDLIIEELISEFGEAPLPETCICWFDEPTEL